MKSSYTYQRMILIFHMRILMWKSGDRKTVRHYFVHGAFCNLYLDEKRRKQE